MKVFLLLVSFFLSFSQSLSDGKSFDTGRKMETVSKYAPPETGKLLSILGAWKIEETIFRNDTAIKTLSGHSEITLNNRGNSFMERSYLYKIFKDESDEYSISLFAKSKGNPKWAKGIVSAYKENVEIFDGIFEDKKLVLQTAARYLGGMKVTLKRLSYTFSEKFFSYLYESSVDYGKNWNKKSKRVYTKVTKTHKMFRLRDDYGKANPNRVKAASEFDFLIGEGDASHHMTLPNGKKINFPSKTTAVYVLNGKAIMEFATVDVDPSLPDAATSIIRIYNRSMQRWENLYLNNRANNFLNFGGRKVGDSIILTNFKDNRASGSMNRYVFHQIQKNTDYDWYGDTSIDAGENFTRFWKIEVRKKNN